jgi:hypothetical protein
VLVLVEVDLSEEVEVFPEGRGFSVVDLELHLDGFCCDVDGFVVEGSLSAIKFRKNAI